MIQDLRDGPATCDRCDPATLGTASGALQDIDTEDPLHQVREAVAMLHRCGIHRGTLFSTLDAEIEALLTSKGLHHHR
jgi:hypothetical protein